MAAQIGGTVIDPEDLLSEAWVSLLVRQQRTGRVPEHLNAYMVVSMRNRLVDELRSPRSRELYIDDIDRDIEEPNDERIGRVDLFHESRLIRRALRRLPAEWSNALIETAVHGRKPAELAPEFGHTPAQFYSLLHRAKAGLRKQLFLSERGPGEIERACLRFANVVATLPASHEADPQLAHQAECLACGRSREKVQALMRCFGLQGEWSRSFAEAHSGAQRGGGGGKILAPASSYSV